MTEQPGQRLTANDPPELVAIYMAATRLDSALGVNSTIFHMVDKHTAYCTTVWQFDPAPAGPTQYRMTLGCAVVGGDRFKGERPYLISQWTVQQRVALQDPDGDKAGTWTDWQHLEKSGMAQDRRDGLPVLWHLLTTAPWWQTLARMREMGAREAMDALTDPREVELWAAWGGPQLGG